MKTLWSRPVLQLGSAGCIVGSAGTDGFEFVVGERGGKRVLIIPDGQHEYVYEVAGSPLFDGDHRFFLVVGFGFRVLTYA